MEAPHRADVGEVGVPDLHGAIGGQGDQAPQLPIVLDVPHFVVLLPRTGLRSRCDTSAWVQDESVSLLDRMSGKPAFALSAADKEPFWDLHP